MAQAIPPTSPSPAGFLRGTAGYPGTNLGGTTVNVGSNPGDLQTSINAALNADGTHKGNTLLVPRGVVYNNITIPLATGSGWTRIMPSGGTLPAAGTRVAPGDTAQMWHIVGDGAGTAGIASRAMRVTTGTQGWHFIGMDATQPNTNATNGLIDIGSNTGGCSRLIFDRIYCHAATAQSRCDRAFWATAMADCQFWDSWLDTRVPVGFEGQCIFFRQGDRIHCENNMFQGATECVMLSDQSTAREVRDITFNRCHFNHPTTMQKFLEDNTTSNPTWDGTEYSIKNNFEIKGGLRVRVDGCIFENLWLQAQPGDSFLINSGGTTGSYQRAVDTMVTNCIWKHVPNCIMVNINGGGNFSERIAFVNNLALLVHNRAFVGDSTRDLWIENNTFVPCLRSADTPVSGSPFGIYTDGAAGQMPRFTLKNNIWGRSTQGVGILLDYAPTLAKWDAAIPDRTFLNNVEFGSAGTYPDGITRFASAAAAGIDTATGLLLTGSPLKNAGSDGKDIGVNHPQLQAAQLASTPPVADTTAPSVPTGLANDTPLSTSIRLTWTASTDAGSGIGGYQVARDGIVVGNAGVSASPSFVDVGLTPSTLYTYTVRAFDNANPANFSAFTAGHGATTAAASSDVAAPPDIMRGFLSRGVNDHDVITTPYTGTSTTRTYCIWSRTEATATNLGRFFNKGFSSAAGCEELFCGTAITFRRGWSAPTGGGLVANWNFPRPTDGVRHCIVISYDASSTANDPVILVDNVAVQVTETNSPGGTVSTGTHAFRIGNQDPAVAIRPFDGDLAKFAVYNTILSAADKTAFYTGTDPMTLGSGPVLYVHCDGTANEPDDVTDTNSTVAGTVVQHYANLTLSITSLAVSSGDPSTGAYQVTATVAGGTANRVEFYVDGVLTRTDSTAPFTLFASDSRIGNTTAGPKTFQIEARVFESAGGTPDDTEVLTVIEPSTVIANANSWIVRLTINRIADAVSYNLYKDGVLVTNLPQPASGDPVFETTVTGNDTTVIWAFSEIAQDLTEGPKLAIKRRYKAATSAAVRPTGFRELSATYIPA